MKIHVFATIMALYPITPTSQIAEEFDIPVYKLREMARKCHVSKSKEFLSEVYRRNGSVTQAKQHQRKLRRIRRVKKLLECGYSEREIALKMKVSVTAVWRYVRILESNNVKE